MCDPPVLSMDVTVQTDMASSGPPQHSTAACHRPATVVAAAHRAHRVIIEQEFLRLQKDANASRFS
jgi:hypothetical protein